MPAVHVRNLPVETVDRLKLRAESHGRSLEGELRDVLEAASTEPVARKRRAINWPTYNSGITTSLDRDEIYPDEDDD